VDRNLQQRLVGVFVIIVFILLIAPVLLDAEGRVPEKITNIPPQPKQPDLSYIQPVEPSEPVLEPLPPAEDVEFRIEAKPEEVKPALTSNQELWSVQVASFRDSNKAIAFRDRLRAADYDVYVREKILSDGSLFTQVFVGPVKSKTEAGELKTQIKSKIGEQGLVVHYRDQ
jgi:DedD protein